MKLPTSGSFDTEPTPRALAAGSPHGTSLLFLVAGIGLGVLGMLGPLAAQPPKIEAPKPPEADKAHMPTDEKDAEPKIPDKKYEHTYEQTFKNSDERPAGWRFNSQAAERLVKFEHQGLRLTVPPGASDDTLSIALISAFGITGDFETTLSFEVLKDPLPEDVGPKGTRFSLLVTLNTPNLDTKDVERAGLNRSMSTKGFSTWMRNRFAAKPLLKFFPIPTTTGRLRLVRSGEDLYYLASVGVDQPFMFLSKHRFGADEVKRISIVGETGGPKASLDVRVTDLRIRADGLPDAPEVATTPNGVTKTAPPRERATGRLALALLVGLAVIGVLALGFFLRRRGAPASSAAERSPVTFPCSDCGKLLKVKANLAGKKVKCIQCGAAVLVPALQAGEPL